MNLGDIFKSVAQQAVNKALPNIKSQIKTQAAVLLLKTPAIPAEYQPVVLAYVDTLIDDWTIKL